MVAIYTLTSILSAFLVFFIQPVVAKIALPTLGGVPAVWNGCMLFFQATLLGGYLYANVLTNRVPLKAQPVIHMLLLFAALLVFPMSFVGREAVDPSIQPMTWLLWMLAYSVGIPFFVISASAPLLQRWFSHTNHKDAANPYFLYAASNIGSMSALLLYPFVVEPFLALFNQVDIWETGVTALSVLFIGVSVFLWKRSVPQVVVDPKVEGAKHTQNVQKISWKERGSWVIFSAVPASLLYGVTTYITTDIAPIPLLWVLPLALYLITFIIVFSSREWSILRLQVCHAPLVALSLLMMKTNGIGVLIIHVVTFFIIALSVHWELSKRKPAVKHLTEFFLWMSLGGVLGGAFNTLVAPWVFNDIYEYPIMLLLSCLLLPMSESFRTQVRTYPKTIIGCIMLGAVAVGLAITDTVWMDISLETAGTVLMALFGVSLAATIFLSLYFQKRQLVFVVITAAITFTFSVLVGAFDHVKVVSKERSIFAAYKVQYNAHDKVYELAHGTTVHGIQLDDPERKLEVKGYYTGILPYLKTKSPKNVGVVGLGIGVLACTGESQDQYDLYEIDPLIHRIAADTRFFSYLRDCAPEQEVIIGDARLQLEKKPEGYYDVLLMDAFNSNAIPMHLVTEEAIGMYFEKLKSDGLLLLNISNRYVDLRATLSSIGHQFDGMRVFSRSYKAKKQFEYSSDWMAMTYDANEADMLLNDEWEEMEFSQPDFVWSDNYSNIVKSLEIFNPLK
jgi:hypothetical protein